MTKGDGCDRTRLTQSSSQASNGKQCRDGVSGVWSGRRHDCREVEVMDERTKPWRVGSKVKRNLYFGDEPIAVLANEVMAQRIAEGMNAAEKAEDALRLLKQYHDGYCWCNTKAEHWERCETARFLTAPQPQESGE